MVINFLRPTEPDQISGIFPLSLASMEFCNIPWKCRNSVEKGNSFRGSAHNSVFHGKLWSLVIMMCVCSTVKSTTSLKPCLRRRLMMKRLKKIRRRVMKNPHLSWKRNTRSEMLFQCSFCYYIFSLCHCLLFFVLCTKVVFLWLVLFYAWLCSERKLRNSAGMNSIWSIQCAPSPPTETILAVMIVWREDDQNCSVP